jgi:hypothetical protein
VSRLLFCTSHVINILITGVLSVRAEDDLLPDGDEDTEATVENEDTLPADDNLGGTVEPAASETDAEKVCL